MLLPAAADATATVTARVPSHRHPSPLVCPLCKGAASRYPSVPPPRHLQIHSHRAPSAPPCPLMVTTAAFSVSAALSLQLTRLWQQQHVRYHAFPCRNLKTPQSTDLTFTVHANRCKRCMSIARPPCIHHTPAALVSLCIVSNEEHPPLLRTVHACMANSIATVPHAQLMIGCRRNERNLVQCA